MSVETWGESPQGTYVERAEQPATQEKIQIFLQPKMLRYFVPLDEKG